MRKLTLLSALLVLLTFAGCECEQVYPTTQNTITPPVRKVLLENYGRRLCPSCMNADDTLQAILNSYPADVIPICVHSGFFAWPDSVAGANLPPCAASNPGSFANDYRCAVGENWRNTFGMGNPTGMVNRRNCTYSQQVIGVQEWRDSLAAVLSMPASAGIALTPVYDSINDLLDVQVSTTFYQNMGSTSGFP